MDITIKPDQINLVTKKGQIVQSPPFDKPMTGFYQKKIFNPLFREPLHGYLKENHIEIYLDHINLPASDWKIKYGKFFTKRKFTELLRGTAKMTLYELLKFGKMLNIELTISLNTIKDQDDK